MIYPPYVSCILCQGSLTKGDQYGICPRCLKEIEWIGDHSCIGCALPLSMKEEGPRCQQCMDTVSLYDRALSVAKYRGEIPSLVYRLKYLHQTYLAPFMGKMMAHRFQREGLKVDIMLAVPAHKSRERARGFNQAELLARYICKEIQIPHVKNTLMRVKDTKMMHTLVKRERKENLEGAFKIKEPGVIVGKDILLIDDIFTTGATLEACSKVIKAAGGNSVTVLTLARGVLDE